jgi:mono/diheme cytochrome c family protein
LRSGRCPLRDAGLGAILKKGRTTSAWPAARAADVVYGVERLIADLELKPAGRRRCNRAHREEMIMLVIRTGGVRYALACFFFALASLSPALEANAQQTTVERGKYLVTLASCTDCHTPGFFFGKPDMARFLGGSEVGFEIPGLGVFVGPNLTPDKETGLGNWTDEQIVAAMQKGHRPDGRVLAPIMPWNALASLTQEDALAIVAYLRSLPPVKNKVAGPFGPNEKPTSFVMKVVPPEGAPAPK